MTMNLRSKLEEKLKAAQASPEISSQFGNLSDAQITAYVQAIDESSYSFDEWLTAILYFQGWLPKDADYGLNDQMEYLICAVEGTMQSGNLLPLKDVLANYLKLEGVEKLGI
jgi:hypothetical protein